MLAGSVLGQEQSKPNTEFKILKIEPNFLESPKYSGSGFDKKSPRSKPSWLEVEVTFEWKPPRTGPKYTAELTFNYYILLKSKSQQYPQGPLLVGSVTHMNISQGEDMHSSVYVYLKALEPFLGGKAPDNAKNALADVGVTIIKSEIPPNVKPPEGQLVASTSWQSKTGEWWWAFINPKEEKKPREGIPQYVEGLVLNKSETPFAPLAFDYFEAIKPKKSEGQ